MSRECYIYRAGQPAVDRHLRDGNWAVLTKDGDVLCDCPPPGPDSSLGSDPHPLVEPLTPEETVGGTAGLIAMITRLKGIAATIQFEGFIEEKAKDKKFFHL